MQPLPTRPKLVSGPSRHVYDAIVLGGQLGGALSAALLAKRGYRVLLVEHDGLGVGYEHGDYLLPYAPFVSPGLKAMPAAEDAFNELGLSTTIQRGLKPSTPGLQLILARHRMDLFVDPAKRAAEFRRELGPAGGDHFQAAFENLIRMHEPTDGYFRKPEHFPPGAWLDRWSFSRGCKPFPGLTAAAPEPVDHPAARLLFSLAPFISYLAAPTPLLLARTLSSVLDASSRYPGGREGLREVVMKKLTDLGGDYLGQETGGSSVVEQLSFEGGKLLGVKVLESDTVYRAPYFIASTDAGALRRLIPEKNRQRSLSNALELLTMPRFLFTVNWVCPAELMPKGMGELLLMETEPQLGPLLIQVTPARKRAGRVEDESLRVVCVAASVPSSIRELGEAHMQTLAERISSHLDSLFPFLRSRLLLRSAPYLDAGGVRGSRLLPHPLYAVDPEHSALGLTGLNPQTPTKNLFLANREVFPGLGLEGELLAAVQAADRVQGLLNKANPLAGNSQRF